MSYGAAGDFARDDERLLTSRSQLKEFAKIPGGFNAHDTFLQLLAPIPADDVATQRSKFDRDLLLGHGVARIALGDVNASGM